MELGIKRVSEKVVILLYKETKEWLCGLHKKIQKNGTFCGARCFQGPWQWQWQRKSEAIKKAEHSHNVSVKALPITYHLTLGNYWWETFVPSVCTVNNSTTRVIISIKERLSTELQVFCVILELISLPHDYKMTQNVFEVVQTLFFFIILKTIFLLTG